MMKGFGTGREGGLCGFASMGWVDGKEEMKKRRWWDLILYGF